MLIALYENRGLESGYLRSMSEIIRMQEVNMLLRYMGGRDGYE